VRWIGVQKNGHLVPENSLRYKGDPTKEEIISLIDTAHDMGLKVYLQLYPEWGDRAHYGELERGPVDNQETFMREMMKVALEWAKIAEKYNVEIFSPACELNVFLDWENNMTWHRSILPKIREKYSGEITQKGELTWEKYRLSPRGDLSFYDHYRGWDYVNADIFECPTGIGNLEDYRDYVAETISNLRTLKEKYSSKGILLGEIGAPEVEKQFKPLCEEHELSSSECRLLIWKLLLDEILIKGKVDAAFFWGWYTQPEDVEQLIKCYYQNLGGECVKETLGDFKDDALLAIHQAEEHIDRYCYSTPLCERAKSILLQSENAFKEGDYPLAKYLANEARATLNPAGICIDGRDEDWTARYEPIARDALGDLPSREKDLDSVWITNDENNLYFMVKFAGECRSDVCLFFDINSDGVWDYHIKAGPTPTFIAKTIRPDYHEFIANLERVCDKVLEFKVPLKLLNYPTTFRFQMFSWDEEKRGDADKMKDFDWIGYSIH